MRTLFRPAGASSSPTFTHGLRRGLHSVAARSASLRAGFRGWSQVASSRRSPAKLILTHTLKPGFHFRHLSRRLKRRSSTVLDRPVFGYFPSYLCTKIDALLINP